MIETTSEAQVLRAAEVGLQALFSGLMVGAVVMFVGAIVLIVIYQPPLKSKVLPHDSADILQFIAAGVRKLVLADFLMKFEPAHLGCYMGRELSNVLLK